MPTVLVTGAAGFLGWYTARELAHRGRQVVGTARDGAGMPPGVVGEVLELGDGGAAGADLVRRLRPAAVIHAAAMADAEACARDPLAATTVNARATGALARAAAGVGAYFVYTSTDLAFDGTAAPYGEADLPAPLGPYMSAKVGGEREMRRASSDSLTVRVALLYGLAGGRKGCFTDGFVEALRAGREVALITDQVRTPAYVGDAARILADLLDVRPTGMLHLGGPDPVTRWEHGLEVARALDLDEGLCRPIRMADLPGMGPRPKDVSLRIDKLVRVLGRVPLGVAEGCRRMRAEVGGLRTSPGSALDGPGR